MNWGKRIFFALILIVLSGFYLKVHSAAKLRLTNIQCKSFDKAFADFRKCDLTVVGRDRIGLNIHVELYKIPVSNVTVNLALLKRVNGYRPFLYNMSADFCKFMKRRKSIPFLKIFFDILLKDSNINHTCPYAHDIVIKELVLQHEHLRFLPLPDGDYMFRLNVGAYNDWKADVRAYFAVAE